MKRCVPFLLLSLTLFVSTGLCRNERIDTLLSRIERAKEEDKITLYSDLAYEYISISQEKFTDNALKAIELAEKYHNLSEKAVALNVLGLGYQRLGNLDTALFFFSQSLSLSEKLQDTANIEKTLRNTGYLFLEMGELHKANSYFERDLKIAIASGDSNNIVRGLENKGIVNVKTGDQEKAVECFIAALKIAEEQKNKKRQVSLLINLAAAFGEFEKIEKARHYLELAIPVAEEIKDLYSLSTIYINMGNYYKNKNHPDSALLYYSQARQILEETRRAHSLVFCYMNIGEIYSLKDDFEKAFTTFEQALALADKSEMKILKAMILFNIGDLYYRKKNYQTAIKYYEKSNSIARSEHAKDIIADSYYGLFDACEQLGDWRNSLEYHKLYTSFKDSIFNESSNARILELETRYESEKKGAEIELLKKTEEIQAREISRQRMRTNMIMVVSGLIFILGLLLFNRYKLKQRQRQTELGKKNIEIEQRLLRSQMNPHFIFNSLNSIQSYISSNNTFTAMSYLSKFSLLMRLVLENTRKPYVSLENEIKTLQLNIEMERIRFMDKYEYTIDLSPGINPQEIFIPPMLVQPYVENAIKHGLLKLKTKGKLSITYSITNGLLVCNVRDNGIGREASAAYNRLHRLHHKSLGMEVTGERISLMRKQGIEGVSFDITDLKDEAMQPSGTNVEIRIPYIKK